MPKHNLLPISKCNFCLHLSFHPVAKLNMGQHSVSVNTGPVPLRLTQSATALSMRVQPMPNLPVAGSVRKVHSSTGYLLSVYSVPSLSSFSQSHAPTPDCAALSTTPESSIKTMYISDPTHQQPFSLRYLRSMVSPSAPWGLGGHNVTGLLSSSATTSQMWRFLTSLRPGALSGSGAATIPGISWTSTLTQLLSHSLSALNPGMGTLTFTL